MKPLFIALLFPCLFILGCGDDITNNYGPDDWQPPLIEWRSVPEAEVRGTIGLDCDVTDNSAIARVRLYLDGSEHQTLTASPYRFEIVTDSLLDGVHVCEARAWDAHGNLGISPILRVNVVNSVAQGPRLIWIPDDYALIQAAINAATDFDTIRVRDGVYYETLNLFGKGIWIESEHGPLRCRIDDAGTNNAFYVVGNQVPATIRGFWMTGSGFLIYLWYGGQANLFNNVMASDSADGLLIALNSGGTIANNLFTGTGFPVQLAYFWGSFFNNILQNAREYAFWNAAIYENPVIYGYNLFWNNLHDYAQFAPSPTDVYGDPLLDLENGRLGEGSPAIDAGNPTLYDLNGTRSDIGPFGGPFAFSP